MITYEDDFNKFFDNVPIHYYVPIEAKHLIFKAAFEAGKIAGIQEFKEELIKGLFEQVNIKLVDLEKCLDGNNEQNKNKLMKDITSTLDIIKKLI